MKNEQLPDDDDLDPIVDDEADDDMVWEEGDPADRRKDPLRRPAS